MRPAPTMTAPTTAVQPGAAHVRSGWLTSCDPLSRSSTSTAACGPPARRLPSGHATELGTNQTLTPPAR